MSQPSNEGLAPCPACGAENRFDQAKCWLCGVELAADEPAANQCPRCGAPRKAIDAPCTACDWAPPPVRQPTAPVKIPWADKQEALRTFSLESVLMIVTLVAVCLGVILQAPGLGIPLAFLSAPALVRTVGIRVRRKALRQPMGVWEKGLAFLGSLAVVTTIAFASITAFFAICFTMGWAAFGTGSQLLFILGWLWGLGAAFVVAFFLVRWLWRRRS